MNNKKRIVLDFLKSPNNYYLDNAQKIVIGNNPCIEVDDVVFVQIKRITFEDEAPRKEAIENVLSTLRFPGINVVYIIRGTKKCVSFYYGIVRNKVRPTKEHFSISSIGNNILKRCIEGNFRGSEVEYVDEEQTKDIINYLKKSKYVTKISGVPGINNEEAVNFQGVDRLIDTMLGDEFAFVVTAFDLAHTIISSIEYNICAFYDQLLPLSKGSNQEGSSTNKATSNTKSTNYSEQRATQNGLSNSKQTSTSQSKSTDKQSSVTKGGSESTTNQSSNTETKTTGSGESNSTSETVSNNKAFTYETSNKLVQDWMKYAEDTLLSRVDYGSGKGLFIACISLFADNELVLRKLENTSTSLFSGEKGNKVPLIAMKTGQNLLLGDHLRNLQIPIGTFETKISHDEVLMRSALAQYVTDIKGYLGNWMSVKELGIIAGLPRKEVVGLTLREEVEFGLNYDDSHVSETNKMIIGSLVHSGNVNHNIKISLSKDDINKHIFVCGVTGCGKTTTCMSLLQKSNMPFLVIEPAKTEYRILANNPNEDIIVFTLGRDDVAPFRFNPLELLPSETISSHIDMVMASIEAAFDMEAAIPQIIESALYKCYEEYGWDIRSNKNTLYAEPFNDEVYAFPTLNDLLRNIETVTKNQGFDERLKNDYIGSIKARLQGLTVGSKGMMLNTPRSIDFTELVHKKVIIELEEIKSGTEKSLIMGFVLSTLCEAIKFSFSKDKKFRHITLVEEAHRLLSKYVPGDSPSKKNGVETFSDMLAEVRKYGEGLIIADQIPEKMAPDVLKNTNTKIVHKIFAQDDKDAIGNTIALSDEQKSYLSTLAPGRAIVFSQGWEKSIQVQIDPIHDTSKEFADLDRIRESSLNYYIQSYKRGIFPELMCCKQIPSVNKLSQIIANLSSYDNLKQYFCIVIDKKDKYCDKLREALTKALESFTIEELGDYLTTCCIRHPSKNDAELVTELLKEIRGGVNSVRGADSQTKYESIFKPNKIKKL